MFVLLGQAYDITWLSSKLGNIFFNAGMCLRILFARLSVRLCVSLSACLFVCVCVCVCGSLSCVCLLQMYQSQVFSVCFAAGRDLFHEHVKEYRLAFSTDGSNFEVYKENGQEKARNAQANV